MNKIIEKYDSFELDDDVIFMNDGYAYLDEDEYPIQNSNIIYNSHNKKWKYQANLYYESIRFGQKYNGTYLDLSCGRGGGINFVKDNFNFCAFYGLDINPNHIKVAKNWLTYGNFHTSSATLIPLEKSSIDVITSVEALGYYEDYFSYYRECYRVLKNDGILIETFPGKPVDSIFYEGKFKLTRLTNIVRNVSISCSVSKFRFLNEENVSRCFFGDEKRYHDKYFMYNILIYEKL